MQPEILPGSLILWQSSSRRSHVVFVVAVKPYDDIILVGSNSEQFCLVAEDADVDWFTDLAITGRCEIVHDA